MEGNPIGHQTEREGHTARARERERELMCDLDHQHKQQHPVKPDCIHKPDRIGGQQATNRRFLGSALFMKN